MSFVPVPTEPRLTAVRSSGGIYRSLEHWRGFAALWVMMFHAIGTQEKPLHPWVELLKVPARPGWLGVHLFFVISGYCIGANVQSLRRKKLGPGAFLRDRLCRILPTYWAAFGVTLLLALAAGRFNHVTAGDNLPAGSRAWLGDLLLIQPYLGTKCYVIVYWTLVVELGFYLVVAALLTISKLSARVAAGSALALALAAVWVPPWSAWLVLACWPEFACGLLIFSAVWADHCQERTWRNLCLAAVLLLGILGGVVAHGAKPMFHSEKQLPFGAMFALLLYALYPLDDAIHRARALKWLSFCGLFSFSLYLIHAPFGVRVYGIGTRFFPETSPAYAGLVLAFCAVSIGASYGFYRVFEARFERWRRHFKARPLQVPV